MKDLLKKLVQADTTAEKGEIVAAELLKDYFAQVGLDSELETWDNNRANVVARVKSSGEKKALLFVCHIDVVPPGDQQWANPPFSGLEKDGKIHGRGSVDMKGGTAAIAAAVKEIVESGIQLKGDLIFAATGAEETDSSGIKRFVEYFEDKRPPLAGVVIPEPTDFEVITSHRGLFWTEISIKGKTAHGSMPHLGINAISLMTELLIELQEYKKRLHKSASMSVNTISGGNAANVIPDHCSISIDFRTTAQCPDSQIIADIENIISKLKKQIPDFNAEININKQIGSLNVDTESQFVKDICEIVSVTKTQHANYATDAPFVANYSAPVVICGPGESNACHKPDECIDFADVEKACQCYKKLILKYLT